MLAVADTVPGRSQAERAYWLMVDRIIRLDLPPGAGAWSEDGRAGSGA